MNGSEIRLLYVFDSADVTGTRSFSFEMRRIQAKAWGKSEWLK